LFLVALSGAATAQDSPPQIHSQIQFMAADIAGLTTMKTDLQAKVSQLEAEVVKLRVQLSEANKKLEPPKPDLPKPDKQEK
jgi:hypothetical protein